MSIESGRTSWPPEMPLPPRVARACGGPTERRALAPLASPSSAPWTIRVPSWPPETVGEKSTNTSQLESDGMDGLQVSVTTLNSPPVAATVTGMDPYVVLVTRKRIESLVAPTGISPKSNTVGSMRSGGGGTPVPVRSMKCGLAAVLSWMQIESDCRPKKVGENCAVNVQVWFFAYGVSIWQVVEQVKPPA